MAVEFDDIRIVGLDEERTTRADPRELLYDVHFVLSADAPVGWGQIAQAHLGPHGVAGRRAWPQSGYVVVRCAVEEIERALTALRSILEETNREYRDWSAAQADARAGEEALDRQVKQKLRELKARLGFD